jgi:type II secretion system protein N
MKRAAAQGPQRQLLAQLLRAAGLGALALLVVLGVAVAFFPFDRLAPMLAARLERETGAETHIESLAVRFGLRGPELSARGVTLRWASGEALALDALALRAARPSAWLRGVPTAHVALEAPFGAFAGELSQRTLRGAFARFDFAQLPPAWFGEGGAPLAGAVDARVDFARSSAPWSGTISVEGGDGSLALPGAPVAIPYERLDASARLDDAGTLHLDSLELAGPMLVARARGTVAGGPLGPASGAIAIDADIERIDPALLPALAQYGIALDVNGAGQISVTGTAAQIEVR